MNQKGFSLLELVIAAAIAMILIFSVTDISLSQTRHIIKLRTKVELNDVKIEILQALRSKVSCLETFKSNTISDSQATSGQGLFTVGKIISVDSSGHQDIIASGEPPLGFKLFQVVKNIVVSRIYKAASDRYSGELSFSVDLGDGDQTRLTVGQVFFQTGNSASDEKPIVACSSSDNSLAGCVWRDSGRPTGPTPLGSEVLCQTNEIAVSGGGKCYDQTALSTPSAPDYNDSIGTGHLFVSEKIVRGTQTGWRAQCCGGTFGTTCDSRAEAMALCCPN